MHGRRPIASTRQTPSRALPSRPTGVRLAEFVFLVFLPPLQVTFGTVIASIVLLGARSRLGVLARRGG